MLNKPRGTRDFNTIEMHKRKFVEKKIRTVFETFGYQEIQTPTFETLELFTLKSGQEILDEIYSFEDKGGRKLSLRPELTAPVIRFYIEKMQMDPKPLKLYYIGNCYRYDRPQKGRYREFTQAGCELIGVDTSESYSELIALSYTILKKVGLKDINLNIGNLKVLRKIFEKFSITKEQQKYLTPLIDKEEWDELRSVLEEYELTDNQIMEFLDLLQESDLEKIEKIVESDKDAKKEITDLKKIIKILKNVFEIKKIKFKISIVRGLDYYTGIVFEIDAPNLGGEKQLCGGGAYELIPLFEGNPTPTSGFAIGFDRTIVALEIEKEKFPELKLDYFVLPVNDETLIESFKITQKLRKKGYIVDIDIKRRNIAKGLKYADSKNAENAIIIGPDELNEGDVTVKNMKTGKQEKIKIEEIINL